MTINNDIDQDWDLTDEGHTMTYVADPADIPVSVAARVIHTLRLDVDRLNNEAMQYAERLRDAGLYVDYQPQGDQPS